MNYQGAANPFALLGVSAPGQVAGLDIVGASTAPMGSFAPQAMAAPAAHAAYQASAVATQQKMNVLAQLAMANHVPSVELGCSDTVNKVKAGLSANFSPEGSVPLRITMYHIAPSIAPFFAVNSIFVARVNLMAGSQPVPAEAFIPNARKAPLEFPIAAAGSQVTVNVTNIDTIDHLFLSDFAAIDLTTASARMLP